MGVLSVVTSINVLVGHNWSKIPDHNPKLIAHFIMKTGIYKYMVNPLLTLFTGHLIGIACTPLPTPKLMVMKTNLRRFEPCFTLLLHMGYENRLIWAVKGGDENLTSSIGAEKSFVKMTATCYRK